MSHRSPGQPIATVPFTAAVVAALVCVPCPLPGQEAEKLREPLPLEVAAALRGHNSRSPISLSPDGRWVAHTVQADGNIPRDSIGSRYSATGFSFAEGDSRMEAMVTNVETGESIRLGGATSASWAAIWSPDGRRVAFYSDEGGEAGLWIWDRESRSAERFPGVIVRPFFGFEGPRWSPDGNRVLVKVLPAGMTIAQANALQPRPDESGRFPAVEPGQPSVVVRTAGPEPAAADPPTEPTGRQPPVGDVSWAAVHLAVLDVAAGTVTRLREREAVRMYAWSADGGHVAYTVVTGWEANSQQSNFDIRVHDLATGEARTLARDARLSYGIEWSWSPDGRWIGFFESGQRGSGELVLVSVADGRQTRVAGDDLPRFAPGEGEVAPLWSADGAHVFAVGGGDLWRADVRAERASRAGRIPGWRIRAIVGPYERPIAWTTDRGRTLWAITRREDGERDGIHAIDLASGQGRAALEEARSYSGTFNLAASDATGQIAFVSTDQQNLHDVWLFDTARGTARRATRINDALDRYELGTVTVIGWRDNDGRPLRGALMLPPGYQPGTRLPLVVWVYGGSMGSAAANRFGFWGNTPTFNMHVLATRGYAVLFPDAPLREGRTMTDVFTTVMPGVNAAIEQGFADPDRLAVMGQSYGSFNTLSIITQTDRFKAAVITAAVLHPDLFADYLRNIGYYEGGQGDMGGSIWEHRDRYLENSPLFRFDRISTPLLIGQGEKDGDLVPVNAIFSALERLGKPVELRLYEAEGHVITQTPNVLDFWRRRLDFLAEHLDVERDERGGIVFDGERARQTAVTGASGRLIESVP